MKKLRRQDITNNMFFSLSGREKAVLILKGAGVVLLIDYCFYHSLAAAIFLFPVGCWFYDSEKKGRSRRQDGSSRKCCFWRPRGRKPVIRLKMLF